MAVYWIKGSGGESIAWAQAVEVELRLVSTDRIIRSVTTSGAKQVMLTRRRGKSMWSRVNGEIALG